VVEISRRSDEGRFLDPAVIARISGLELRARTIVEGFLSGLHRSPLKGFSVEFAEYRQYLPGDDLSTIDWKVFARSDRYYVKKYEEETNLRAHVLLDVSGSMSYGSGAMTKRDYGSCLAASLAYLMNRQRDAAGLVTFDERILGWLQPSIRPGHLRALLLTLDKLPSGARTDAGPPLHQLADSLAKRGMIVLISDLLDEPAPVIDGLKHFRFRGNDVLVLHVLDHAELTFPFDRPITFRDMETGQEVIASPSEVREHYLAGIRGLVDTYQRELRSVGIDYQLVDTSEPLDRALLSYLAVRGRRQ
jgi:uncharacterized protein (DUF58 family)